VSFMLDITLRSAAVAIAITARLFYGGMEYDQSEEHFTRHPLHYR
ncbi:4050_t:CDS:1, partial [Ambispora leptoticha]